MNAHHFDVLIIGAGLSGIGTACHLQAALPHKTIAVLERRERMGGTWDLFRYPGVRSDSDMYTFGFKFRPWMDVKVLADGAGDPRVHRRHRRGVRDRREDPLRPESADRRVVQPREPLDGDGPTRGDRPKPAPTPAITSSAAPATTTTTRATSRPFPGVDRFEGRCIHPQHWPEDLDYAGKKVVVIGSGATAVTLVPAMAGDAEHVTMLQRSPSYVFSLPALDKISAVPQSVPSREVGVRARTQAATSRSSVGSTWRAAAGRPRCAVSCSGRSDASVGPSVRHEPLHAELHAVGRAAVCRCRTATCSRC